MKKRTVALLMAAVLLFGAAVGGTMALLTQKTDTITNTFTAGKVAIALTESKPSDSERGAIKVIPGATVDKDPKITVKTGSEACYVFVKVDAHADLSTYVDYSVDTTIWAPVPDVAGVWYKKIDTTVDSDIDLDILTNDQVTFDRDLTATQISQIPVDGMGLAFTGYAVQSEGVADVNAAWDIAKAL